MRSNYFGINGGVRVACYVGNARAIDGPRLPHLASRKFGIRFHYQIQYSLLRAGFTIKYIIKSRFRCKIHY